MEYLYLILAVVIVVLLLFFIFRLSKTSGQSEMVQKLEADLASMRTTLEQARAEREQAIFALHKAQSQQAQQDMMLDNLQQQVDEQRRSNHVLDSKLSDYNRELTNVKGDLQAAYTRNEALKNELEKERRLHEEEFKANSEQYTSQLKELQGTHLSNLKIVHDQYANTRAEHERELERVKKAADQQLTETQQRYEREIAALQGNTQTQVEETKRHYEQLLANVEANLATTTEQLNQQLADTKQQLTQQLTDSKQQLTTQNDEIKTQLTAQLTQQRQQYEQQLAQERSEHKQQFSAQKSNYEQQLSDQKTNFEQQLSDQKATYEQRLQEQTQARQQQLAEVKQAHARELATLTAQQTEQVSSLKEFHNENLTALKTKYEKELGSLTSKFEQSRSEALQEKDKAYAVLKQSLENQLTTEKQNYQTTLTALQTTYSQDKATLQEHYEKQLATEKAHYEDVLQQLRTQHAQELAEKQRIFDKTLTTQEELHQQALAQQKQQHQADNNLLREELKVASNEIVTSTSTNYYEKNREHIEAITKPIQDQMKAFTTQARELIEKSNLASEAFKVKLEGFDKQILRINDQTEGLIKALRGSNKKALGNWGETQLEVLLQSVGLVKDLHYFTQKAYTLNNKRVIPDFILRLPDNREIIIDSKVSLSDYTDAFNAKDKDMEALAIKRMVQATEDHIKNLSKANYSAIPGINCPTFVLMYVPIDNLLAYLAANKPHIFAEAMQKNVAIVSNSTLMPLLTLVMQLWDNQNLNKYARSLTEVADKMFDAIVRTAVTTNKLGKNVQQVVNEFNNLQQALTSQQGVFRRLEKYNAQVKRVSNELDTLEPLSKDSIKSSVKLVDFIENSLPNTIDVDDYAPQTGYLTNVDVVPAASQATQPAAPLDLHQPITTSLVASLQHDAAKADEKAEEKADALARPSSKNFTDKPTSTLASPDVELNLVHDGEHNVSDESIETDFETDFELPAFPKSNTYTTFQAVATQAEATSQAAVKPSDT